MTHSAPLVAPQPALAAALAKLLGADLLAHVFTVDEDSITVGDLKLGDKIDIHTPAEEVIVSVSFVAAETAEGDEFAEGGAEPEVMEKGKKEEDGD